MVSRIRIRGVVRQIAERFRPERIILFGSYADGHPDEHSDVDLLVLLKGRRVHDRSLLIREAIEVDFAMESSGRALPSRIDVRNILSASCPARDHQRSVRPEGV